MLIRELSAGDRASLAELLLSLTAQDRYLRFCGYIDDAGLEAYAAALDFARVRVHGAFDPRGQLIGVVELAVDGRRAELAFAVRSSNKGRGVGHELMMRALSRARLAGVRHLELTCLVDNRAMFHLARQAGMHPASHHGEVFAQADLDPPQPADYWQALLEDGVAGGALAADAVRQALMGAVRSWSLLPTPPGQGCAGRH